jgi:hypothetical protein
VLLEETIHDHHDDGIQCPVYFKYFQFDSNEKMNLHVDKCLQGIQENDNRRKTRRNEERKGQIPNYIESLYEEDEGEDFDAFPRTKKSRSNRSHGEKENLKRVKMYLCIYSLISCDHFLFSINEPKKKQWYTGMTTAALRALLQSEGIPSHACDRKTMERRHARFVNIWNAVCDDENDLRMPQDLIKEVLRIEKMKHDRQGNDKMKSNEAHENAYKDHFMTLIEQARASTIKHQKHQQQETDKKDREKEENFDSS